jgi:hypothetical protein
MKQHIARCDTLDYIGVNDHTVRRPKLFCMGCWATGKPQRLNVGPLGNAMHPDARHGETDRLRRIRDDRELSAAIFSF